MSSRCDCTGAAIAGGGAPAAGRRSFLLTCAIPIVMIWIALFLAGYPPPMYDDLFMTGAAINLAENGRFVNLYLADWSERAHDRFYFQPPFHQRVLAGWLHVFGASARSLLAFQNLCHLAFSIFAALLLRRYRFPRILTFLLVLAYACWMFKMGLRQDALAGALLAAGLWSLTKDTAPRYLAGLFCLGASVLSAPVAIAAAAPLGLAVITHNMRTRTTRVAKYWLPRAVAFAIAGSALMLLFLAAVRFEPAQFASDFLWHASFRRKAAFWVAALKILSTGYRPITDASVFVLLAAIVAMAFLRRRDTPAPHRTAACLLAVAALLTLVAHATTLTYGHVHFFAWCAIFVMITALPAGARRKAGLAAALGLFLAHHSASVVALLAQEPSSPAYYRGIRQDLRAFEGGRFVVDEVAARFVFDYRLPEGAVNWNYYGPAPQSYPRSSADRRPGDVWIVSPCPVYGWEVLPPFRKARLWGMTFRSIGADRYRLLVIGDAPRPEEDQGAWGDGSDSRASSSGPRPERTASTIRWRNPGGYGSW